MAFKKIMRRVVAIAWLGAVTFIVSVMVCSTAMKLAEQPVTGMLAAVAMAIVIGVPMWYHFVPVETYSDEVK